MGNPMRLKLFCLVLALFNPAVMAAEPKQKTHSVDEFRKYIGIEFPPYPDNIKKSGGALVDQPSKGLKFSIQTVENGKQMLLWFAQEASSDKKGVNKWKVMDVMKYPTFPQGEALVMQLCRIGGDFDQELMAVVKYNKYVEILTDVKRAWRANRDTGKFEKISTKEIECINESYGL